MSCSSCQYRVRNPRPWKSNRSRHGRRRDDYHDDHYNRYDCRDGKCGRDRYDHKYDHKKYSPQVVVKPQPLQVREVHVRLSGDEEVPVVATTMYGTAKIYIPSDNSYVEYEIRVYNINSQLRAAHFHSGRAGTNGPVVKNINTFGRRHNEYVSRGRWTMTDQQQPLTPAILQAMQQNLLYINVHTTRFPMGEIRGQINV